MLIYTYTTSIRRLRAALRTHLHKTVFDFDLEELEVGELGRQRHRHVLLVAERVRQTAKARLGGKRQAIPEYVYA